MVRPHRILYIYRSISENYGGALVDLLNILARLDPTRYAATVLLSCGNDPMARLRRLGVEAVSLPLPSLRKGKSIPFLPFAVLRLWRLLRAREIALVHVNDADDAAIASMACRLAGIPCVAHMRSEMAPSKFKKLHLEWADLLIAVSEGVRQQAMRGGLSQKKVVTLYSGIDLTQSEAAEAGLKVRLAYGIAPETLVVGSVANIVPIKGYEFLIRAVAKARRSIPDLTCLSLGDDDRGLREGLQRLGRSLGLNGCLHFAGFQVDVSPYLQAMDLFVLASVEEGFGIALLEAMAMGKPVVATATSGSSEIVEDGRTGLLVPPRDADALAEAIVALLKAPERRVQMGRAGKERVKAVFSRDAQMTNLTALYDQLLLERRSAPHG